MHTKLVIFSTLIVPSLGCMRIDFQQSVDSTSTTSSDSTASAAPDSASSALPSTVFEGSTLPDPTTTISPTTTDSTSTGTTDNQTGAFSTDTSTSTTFTTDNEDETTGCGDGIIETGEICDDGNQNENDLCKNDCTAICGNGILDLNANEECDDGNLKEDDACNSMCKKNGMLVFISSNTFSGGIGYTDLWPLGTSNDITSRIDDAHMHCTKLAEQAFESSNSNLKWYLHPPKETFFPFKAWISDNWNSPTEGDDSVQTFSPCNDRPYINTQGTVIASSFDELTATPPLHQINVDETSTKIASNSRVWTGTFSDGTPAHEHAQSLSDEKNSDCKNWFITSNQVGGVTGTSYTDDNESTEHWSNDGNISLCHLSDRRIYCFEQCPE